MFSLTSNSCNIQPSKFLPEEMPYHDILILHRTSETTLYLLVPLMAINPMFILRRALGARLVNHAGRTFERVSRSAKHLMFDVDPTNVSLCSMYLSIR